MKISKNSWHYRFIQATGEIPKHGLCDYVWQVLKPLGVLAILFIIAVIVTFPIGETIITQMSVAPVGNHWLTYLASAIVGLIAGTVIVIVSAIFVVCACNLKDKVFTNNKNGVTMSYIKAKKEKSCPIIEFED